jgi:hypothetical protein
MSNIEFNVPNIKKCLCPECPVQSSSRCIEGRKRLFLEIAYSSESGMYFERERVPGLYCTTGMAYCQDLNFNKICKCPQCPIWNEYELNKGKSKSYYCQKGKAQKK